MEDLPLPSIADTDEEFSEYDYENETFAIPSTLTETEDIALPEQNFDDTADFLVEVNDTAKNSDASSCSSIPD